MNFRFNLFSYIYIFGKTVGKLLNLYKVMFHSLGISRCTKSLSYVSHLGHHSAQVEKYDPSFFLKALLYSDFNIKHSKCWCASQNFVIYWPCADEYRGEASSLPLPFRGRSKSYKMQAVL